MLEIIQFLNMPTESEVDYFHLVTSNVQNQSKKRGILELIV